MSEIELEPLEGGEKIKLKDEKIVIGRGPFLQVHSLKQVIFILFKWGIQDVTFCFEVH